MSHVKVDWHRLFAVYLALAAVCLAAGACTRPPLHDILLVIGVVLLAGFFPLILAIYFVRGFLGIQ